MLEYKVYQGDIGTWIILDIGQDISQATVTNVLVKKPDGTEVTWVGGKYTINSEENYIRYVIQDGDLDQVGTYDIQAYIEMVGWKGKGENVEFVVYKGFS